MIICELYLIEIFDEDGIVEVCIVKLYFVVKWDFDKELKCLKSCLVFIFWGMKFGIVNLNLMGNFFNLVFLDLYVDIL